MAGNYRYQYETSPRKLQPEYIPQNKPTPKKYPKKSTAKKAKPEVSPKKKAQLKNQRRVIKYVFIAFGIIFAISYRNSQIAEEFSQVKSLQTNLAAIQKENQQLEVNIESSLNLNNVEQSAKELLGMQKRNNSQSVYINLPRQDYVEPATEEVVIEDGNNWFTSILNKLLQK